MRPFIFYLLIFMFYPIQGWASFDSAMTSYEQKDYYSAQKEFKKLAAQNDSDAQYMLGYMYAVGKGVIQDYIEAHKWFNIAASRGNQDAIKARDQVERHMTRDQIALSQKKAREWTPGLHKTPMLSSAEIQKSEIPAVIELADKATIKQVQSKLNQLGYQAGTADGAMGNNTRKAIRYYQKDNQLTVNGKLTQKLVDALFPGGIPESAIHLSSGKELLFDRIWKDTEEQQDNVAKNHKQLIKELSDLLAQGRQKRAAQSWFLDDLADLISQSQTAWSVMVLSDNFSDGDFTLSPHWSVQQGHFEVNENGLFSNETTNRPQTNKPQKQGTDNLSMAILGAVLEHATKDRKQTKQPVPTVNGLSRINVNKMIPNRFAMKVKISLHSREGRVEMGPYSGTQQGYQLSISPEHNLIELLRVDSRNSAVIESIRQDISLNKAHIFEWLRDKNGQSIIAMDGKELFKVTDKRYKDNFSGFMLNNIASSLTLQDIKIVAKQE